MSIPFNLSGSVWLAAGPKAYCEDSSGSGWHGMRRLTRSLLLILFGHFSLSISVSFASEDPGHKFARVTMVTEATAYATEADTNGVKRERRGTNSWTCVIGTNAWQIEPISVPGGQQGWAYDGT